jgi:hypothetical protein
MAGSAQSAPASSDEEPISRDEDNDETADLPF